MGNPLRHIVPVALACLLAAGIGRAEAAVVALDGLAADAVSSFDRDRAERSDKVVVTSVQDGSVIPRNDRYPLIEWLGPEGYGDAFLLELQSPARSLQVLLKGRKWQPADDEFAGFLTDKELSVSVLWRAEGRTYRTAPVRLVIADIPMKQRVAFRTIQQVFQPMKPNAIRLFSMEQRGPAPVMELDGTCVGCHAYSAEFAWFSVKKKSERQLLKMTPGAQGVQLTNQAIGEFTFLSIAPKGRYAVIVRDAVGDLTLNNSVLVPFDYFFRTADIWCYDAELNTMVPLPGASDPNYVEDMPKISPDGLNVLFSRYKVVEENGVKGVPTMDLYEVPLNGCKGGEPRLVVGASPGATHNYFGRYVPNGKWLSCTRGEGRKGIFALPSSDIYLLARDGSTIRKMNLNRDDGMDSWHDWSGDSHWLVFSSKRDKNLLTALYLAYVDDEGKDYPPVKLYGSDTFKVNTPVFVPDELLFEDAAKVRGYVYGMYAASATAPAPAAPATAAPAAAPEPPPAAPAAPAR
jgi:hypothetical protein